MTAPSGITDLKPYLDNWAATHASCEPADRALAEAGVHLAYEVAGLPPPRVLWCEGPGEIVEHLTSATLAREAGTSVKIEVLDQVRARIADLAELFWKEILTAAGELAHHRGSDVPTRYAAIRSASAASQMMVIRSVNRHFNRFPIRAKHLGRRMRGHLSLLPRAGFDEVSIGPHDLISLGVYAYINDVCGWSDPTGALRGLWQVGRNAAWLLPHRNICWISERPSIVSTDAMGRLHCVDGPALCYRDGWAAHAWKGVQVPAWAIEHPEKISLAHIAGTFEPSLRNSLIEIMTPERFIRQGGAVRVATDETGVLWRRLWGYRGFTIGSWTAVEVVNGTAESDGSRRRFVLRVPSRMRTPREAVAWTYGLTAERYANLELRT